jgi:hypothetical protein
MASDSAAKKSKRRATGILPIRGCRTFDRTTPALSGHGGSHRLAGAAEFRKTFYLSEIMRRIFRTLIF